MATEKNFGMRLTLTERRQIERLAHAKDMTMKQAVLDAVQHQLDELDKQTPFVPTGRLKAAQHLIGTFDGPTDLTTNKEYMDGYGA